MIQVFAWLTDMMLYRLGQVPQSVSHLGHPHRGHDFPAIDPEDHTKQESLGWRMR
jgi:hypothetical protein